MVGVGRDGGGKERGTKKSGGMVGKEDGEREEGGKKVRWEERDEDRGGRGMQEAREQLWREMREGWRWV